MKVTFLGDSIRFGVGEQISGYGKRAAELLGPDFEVFQPDDNCRFAKYTLRMLFDYASVIRESRIVHFNCGHWDLCEIFGDGTFSTEEEYVDNLVRIARILKSFCDVVIFATTTPVLDANPYNRNCVIERFNEIAVAALEKEGVIINDLHALLADDKERYILASDNIHLTSEGVEVCARAVANIVAAEAEKLA
ncbi:MAG: SGNH/GDSL hydrolase family protein [Clostridia bacterium]|nr:SGNH/GDSL hydrolase family protein [Clostridia bacterium]